MRKPGRYSITIKDATGSSICPRLRSGAGMIGALAVANYYVLDGVVEAPLLSSPPPRRSIDLRRRKDGCLLCRRRTARKNPTLRPRVSWAVGVFNYHCRSALPSVASRARLGHPISAPEGAPSLPAPGEQTRTPVRSRSMKALGPIDVLDFDDALWVTSDLFDRMDPARALQKETSARSLAPCVSSVRLPST